MPSPVVTDPIDDLTQDALTVLRRVLGGAGRVALLDFPAHTNAGDSLIYLGQDRLLRAAGCSVGYVADTRTYDPGLLRRRVPEGPILLQGGGNLGDRWRPTQEFRERVIADFPDRTIVQLPQSIEFTDPDRQRRAAEIFARHPDLRLLMRDHRSLARARAAFPANRVEFCPDLAVGYGRAARTAAPDRDVVLLLRGDSEQAAAHRFTLPPGTTVLRTDWGFRGWARTRWSLLMTPSAVSSRVPALRDRTQRAVERSFGELARFNVAAASAILSRGRIVVTDRLHATVLAALLGIPVIALDNVNGKISAAQEAYLHRWPEIRFAADAREAGRAVRDGLAGAAAGPRPVTDR
jgi:exopolysaccharide biosynthesis predicted pyruvyltransferase EpsI